ncbi:MAG: NADPH-dependent oxidoreductase, partial [Alphaproteobacteria bacterium]|nr:NADPH-dependent oxidoreductase [Alphaproteobacteria bacterium]
YDDDKLAGGIDAYDRRRDAVYSIPADKQRDLDRYGEAGFYGWSEDKARQVSHTERQDFGAFLRRQGYRLD